MKGTQDRKGQVVSGWAAGGIFIMPIIDREMSGARRCKAPACAAHGCLRTPDRISILLRAAILKHVCSTPGAHSWYLGRAFQRPSPCACVQGRNRRRPVSSPDRQGGVLEVLLASSQRSISRICPAAGRQHRPNPEQNRCVLAGSATRTLGPSTVARRANVLRILCFGFSST